MTNQNRPKVWPTLQFGGECAQALDLYKEVFGADVQQEKVHTTKDAPAELGLPPNWVVHSSMILAGTEIMAYDDPAMLKGGARMPAAIYVSVDDVDEWYQKALTKGFTNAVSCYGPEGSPSDMFWGDRCASTKDPWGNLWVVGSEHKQPEDSEEMKANAMKYYAQYK